LSGAVRAASAILATWFLGSETGHALADIVFGAVAPQGRLPVSFPQKSGQEPFYYNHRSTGRPQLGADPAWKARYREVTNEALYPFGYGLGYSTASYSRTTVDRTTLANNSSIIVSAMVTNTGSRAMREVAQLYIHDKVASLTQPIRALKGIRHLDLDPGQTVQVAFTLRRSDLTFVHPDGRRFAEPGTFDVWVAPSAVAGIPASIVLV
ncbi:glycoside hydrolase family 3 C-terminal domain-containing protein, partial [Sphingomonas sp. TREG-RG-20F-R18-01]|uniref:fibronectin type III-like domain-contianing protein n=1 Tax=Sphingomonas sp. TREG-RG-20F-R18-01 TaxID=2914982 RepID=UPI001F5A6ED7